MNTLLLHRFDNRCSCGCEENSSRSNATNLEWRIIDLAASLYGKALVPLYDNFGPDSIGAFDAVSSFGFRTLNQCNMQNTCKPCSARLLRLADNVAALAMRTSPSSSFNPVDSEPSWASPTSSQLSKLSLPLDPYMLRRRASLCWHRCRR